jgi:hypothetical protein
MVSGTVVQDSDPSTTIGDADTLTSVPSARTIDRT